MPIIATAGHVDHGKSTLIQALTGRDPDRWREEKERGLTIDLGFAWRELGGHDVGFVDVPGHERFIKNMLAGVGAVDVALFVVAADEGWMPQTEEHLAVLDMLDTRFGVVALSRADLADEDTIDLAELEIIERTEGTSLSDWPIVRVSAVDGAGLETLEQALIDQLNTAGEPRDDDNPRLWIDRAFHISGAGLVVTGTLTEGTLSAEDELVLWPQRTPVRIRGVHHHDQPVARLGPGARTALNISGVDGAERGMLLAGSANVATTTRLLGSIRRVRSLDEDLTARGAYHLHLGTGSWPVRLRLVGTDLCVISSDTPVPVRCGDRYLLRETGRRAVVAGGAVLDPHPTGKAGDMAELAKSVLSALQQDRDAVADALLTGRGRDSLANLAADSGGGVPKTPFTTGGLAMAHHEAASLAEAIVAATKRFHEDNRLRPGLPKAEVASSLDVDVDVISLAVSGSDKLVDNGATIRATGFAGGMTGAEEAAWQSARATLAAGLAVPRASQLGLEEELLHALIRAEELIRIADDLVYLPDQIAEIRSSLSDLPAEFTVAEFRDHIGVTRRQAIPLLEWMDKSGITRRRGDVRTVRDHQ